MSQQSGRGDEQSKSVRDGFGDDAGTRVGRPDAPAPDDRSMARLSEESVQDEDSPRIEGSVLDERDDSAARGSRRPDGSDMSGGTNDHAQRAQAGMGSEASEGMHGAQRGGASIRGGTDEEAGDRPGSEPLAGRQREHKSGYGGEGGEPRTSSDKRERPDYYGNEGTGGRGKSQ
jgi:hypothetical protein